MITDNRRYLQYPVGGILGALSLAVTSAILGALSLVATIAPFASRHDVAFRANIVGLHIGISRRS